MLDTNLKAVSSDCKPWPAQLRFRLINGIVSQERSPEWFENIDKIYREYEIYSQAAGVEQAVFMSADGAGETRSKRLVSCLQPFVQNEGEAIALDVGCGNGSFLRELNQRFPKWHLEGSEYAELNRETVLSLPGVEAFHTCSLEGLDRGGYSFVSMIHLLEHISEPLAFLKSAKEVLADDGLLFIQVPGFLENPFELLIYDHASHFTPETLRSLVTEAGLEVVEVSTEWVKKEISLVARKSTSSFSKVSWEDDVVFEALQDRVNWLEDFRVRMLSYASSAIDDPWIFGSSIAASWAYAELGGKIAGFLDEDPARSGRSHLGRPIFAPDLREMRESVIVPIAPSVSEKIRRRYASVSKRWMF